MHQMDQSGANRTEWNQNGLNRNEVDRIRLNGLNKTE